MKQTILSFLCLSALTLSAVAQDNPAADNTEKNQRDRSGETKTSGDQSNSPEDLKITAAIRRAVVADDSLSATAKNVKIITANEMITLRGGGNADLSIQRRKKPKSNSSPNQRPATQRSITNSK